MDKKPVLLIIGGRGFLGEHLAKEAASSWDFWVAGRWMDSARKKSVTLDVTDAQSVQRTFVRARPDVVVLLAAISDIDRCEREPDLAWDVNVKGALNVAEACARTGSRLIFTSSAAVFDGKKHGYREDDSPNPLSVYGRTKLEAEFRLAAALPSAVIVRSALVLGLSSRKDTNAVLNRWVESWHAGNPVPASTVEYRNPVDVRTLAKVILALAQHPEASGIYHVGASDAKSRCEIACQAATALGYPASWVLPQAASPPDRAPRGLDHFLVAERLQKIFKVSIGDTHEVVRRSLRELTESSLRAGIQARLELRG